MRDYGVDGQIGLEGALAEYHRRLLEVTAECMRVLKPTGVMFWNHGDNYTSSGGASRHKGYSDPKYPNGRNGDFNEPSAYPQGNIQPKSLFMQNERLIIRMIDEQGWILRNRIIWHKSNGMPSSVTDRFSNKYEPVYMLVKQRKYWFDLDAVRVPHESSSLRRYPIGKVYKTSHIKNNGSGYAMNKMLDEKGVSLNPLGKNPGDVWTIPTYPYPESHFATFPPALIEPMIKAACPAEICPVCGLARERITEKEIEFTSGSGKAGNPPKGKYKGSAQAESGTYDIRMGPKVTHHTIGWTDCGCGAGWIAGTVLDPFCGSGTVLEVCRRLNRNAIGFELNPDYEPLIRERSMAHTPPLTSYFGAER